MISWHTYDLLQHPFLSIIVQHKNLRNSHTVKPVLRGHLQDKENVALLNRCPLKRGSIHMKFTMTGQENVTF